MITLSLQTMTPDWRPCTYTINEINCNSRRPAREQWSGGRDQPFIELKATCPGYPTGYSPKHTMYGLHLVVWDYVTQESRFVIPLGDKGLNPLSGGQFLVISRDNRSPPWNMYGTGWTFTDGWRDNVDVVLPEGANSTTDPLPFIQFLPADDFWGAIILYQSRTFTNPSARCRRDRGYATTHLRFHSNRKILR